MRGYRQSRWIGLIRRSAKVKRPPGLFTLAEDTEGSSVSMSGFKGVEGANEGVATAQRGLAEVEPQDGELGLTVTLGVELPDLDDL